MSGSALMIRRILGYQPSPTHHPGNGLPEQMFPSQLDLCIRRTISNNNTPNKHPEKQLIPYVVFFLGSSMDFSAKCPAQVETMLSEKRWSPGMADGFDDYDLLFKFIVVGDSGSGKSCILHQYIHKKCTLLLREVFHENAFSLGH